MSTKLQNKRITKHIRVSEHFHRRVKLEAARQGKTMSKFTDKMIENYFIHKDESSNY